MSIDGQYQMQQTGWGNSCSQADWQQTFQQSPPVGSPDNWSNYAGSGVPYVPEMPRVPPMYHHGLADPGYQHPNLAQDDYTWGKNLLDASNYINHFGNHASTVARRNERERNRVRHINSTFDNLRQHLPCSSKKKKLSKVDTLRTAIKYINHLQNILGKDMKPLTQHIKQENSTISSCSSTSASNATSTTSSSTKRQSLDSSTASTSSVDNTLGHEREEEDESERESSSPESLPTDQTPVSFLDDAQFQWTS